MSSYKNIFLISYDITNDRRRNKIARILEQYGYERIQYSVFTGLHPPHRNKELWQKITTLIDATEFPGDKIFCFGIAKKAFIKMKIIGNFNADIEYLVGLKNTEFF